MEKDDGKKKKEEKNKRYFELIIITTVIAVVFAVAIPFTALFRKGHHCLQAAREFENNIRRARNVSIQVEGRTFVHVDPKGMEYAIKYRPEKIRKYQVSALYSGTRIQANGGRMLVFFVENVEPKGTSMKPVMDYNQRRYYPVVFKNGRVQYQVRIFKDGSTKIVKM